MTGKFLNHLVAIPRWQYLPPGVAEQLVQRSAYPQRYAPQEPPAAELVGRFWTGPDNPSPPPPDDRLATLTAFSTSTGCGDQGGSNIALDPQVTAARLLVTRRIRGNGPRWPTRWPRWANRTSGAPKGPTRSTAPG